MATSQWMKFMLVTAMLMACAAVADAQKGGAVGGEGLVTADKGAATQKLLSITGKAVDSTGQPLKGVEIEVTIEGIAKIFDVKTKKKGKFNLRVPFKDTQYVAHARLDGYRHVDTLVANDEAGNLIVEIRMEKDSGPVEGPEPVGEKAEAEPELTDEQVAAVTAYNEAVRAMKAGDRESAKANFAQATTIDPELEKALTAQAALAYEDKDWETVADATEKLLRLQPDELRTLQMAYVANYMTGNAEGLASAARRLAELDPPMVERDMLRNANSSFESGRTDLCRALMEVAVDARPDLAEARLQLGLCCNDQGDSSCAKQAFSSFLDLAPEHADAPMVTSLLDYLE
jgi:tetratricopeptide (TPR) repeat protein